MFFRKHNLIMSYLLFLDDTRDAVDTYGIYGEDMIVARSTHEAQEIVLKQGMPSKLLLDHDLGGDDRAMDFLKWLANEYWDGQQSIPDYEVHSSNAEGKLNLQSYMKSWKNSL